MHNCYLCGSDVSLLHDFVSGENSHTIYKCSNCGLSRTYPEPEKETLRSLYVKKPRLYSKGYREVYNSAFFQKLKEWFVVRPLLKGLQKRLKSIRKPRLLDVGCSTGWITAVAVKMGFAAKGLEANPYCAKIARDRFKLNVLEGFLEDIESEEKFDAVTMFHVVEHFAYPRPELKRVNKLLSDKGRLLVVVPNGESLGTKIFKKNYSWNMRHHVSYFSKNSLKMLLEESGFKVVKLTDVPSTPLLLTSYNRMIRKKLGKNSSFGIRNKVLGNFLMLPLAIAGKVVGQAEVLAVYCEKK